MRWLTGICILALGQAALADDLDPAAVEFFESRIRPVLVEQCYECHSADSRQLRGNLRVARQVLVARGGLVEGDIETREAIVGGEVRGQIRALERLEIQAGAVVHGDLSARVLLVQEGGEVNGVVRMGAGAELESVAVT